MGTPDYIAPEQAQNPRNAWTPGGGPNGAAVGPDGRIYWSVGDMGMNVVGPDGRRWVYFNQGTVLRSELDGSGNNEPEGNERRS